MEKWNPFLNCGGLNKLGPKYPPKVPKKRRSTENGRHPEKERTFLIKKLESFLLALAFLGVASGPKIFFRADSSEILHAGSTK